MRWTGLAVLALALGGCAAAPGSGPTAPPTTAPPTVVDDALAACRLALPGQDVVSATESTVDSLRAWGYGGPVAKHPLANAFPSAAPTDDAMWCWTRQAADDYVAWGVWGTTAVRAIGLVGPTTTIPSGPPIIP
jgi:hypothetical protein